jgi:hypothetical protein
MAMKRIQKDIRKFARQSGINQNPSNRPRQGAGQSHLGCPFRSIGQGRQYLPQSHNAGNTEKRDDKDRQNGISGRQEKTHIGNNQINQENKGDQKMDVFPDLSPFSQFFG